MGNYYIKRLLVLFFVLITTTDSYAKDAFLVGGVQISTHDPNLLSIRITCRNVNTDKKEVCIGSQLKLGGWSGYKNEPFKIPKTTKQVLSNDTELTKIRYRMGDFRQLAEGTYVLDNMILGLGSKANPSGAKRKEYTLSQFNFKLVVAPGRNYLGDLHFMFGIDNLYRLQAESVELVDSSSFATKYMGKSLSRKYAKEQKKGKFVKSEVSIGQASAMVNPGIDQWGALPSLEHKEECSGWRNGFRRAEVVDGVLILDREARLRFPMELWASVIGCAINKHLISNSYTQYKLSSKWERANSNSVYIPIEFR
jgi:hypothetical protein